MFANTFIKRALSASRLGQATDILSARSSLRCIYGHRTFSSGIEISEGNETSEVSESTSETPKLSPSGRPMIDREERDARTVFVRNLAYTVDWMELKDHMQECGNIDYVRVIKDRETQQSRGFATVVYSNLEGAQRAIDELSDTEFEGRRMFIREHKRPEFSSENSGHAKYSGSPGYNDTNNYTAAANKVFVGNLSWTTSSEELQAYIQSAVEGEVEKCVVLGYEDGRSKGVAIVDFVHEEDAAKAIEELNQTELNGRTLFMREDRGAQRQDNDGREKQYHSRRHHNQEDDEEGRY